MAVPDYLLDVSWSVQYMASAGSSSVLYSLLRQTRTHASNSEQLHDLSMNCRDYISSRAPTYRDELNDETEKTGVLRECVVDHVKVFGSDKVLGLSIETRYQKTTYKVILVASLKLDPRACPVTAIMYKASQSHVKTIKSWLDEKFGISWASPLVFPPRFIPRVCSEFLMGLDAAWEGDSGSDALRQATLRQVVGNLRITITISNATGSGIAPQLKSMDFDVPAETVGILLKKTKERRVSDEYAFLDELAEALHDKTGLRMPLTDKVRGSTVDANDERQINGSSQPENEPPLKITRIHCAAFALRADGGIKVASRPIEDAEVVGYDGHAVRTRYTRLLQSIFEEADRRQHEE